MMNAPIKISEKEPSVYAAWSKDRNILMRSSSGGMFGVFARYLLENKGVVFGAAYNRDLSVTHIKVQSQEDLIKLHGSKYVQSFVGLTYQKVKDLLNKNRYVLFSGLPCQVAGLYGFLGEDKYENLFTCDLVCHGVPSPGVFKNYIDYLEIKEMDELTTIEMRSKEKGWMQGSKISLRFNKDNSRRIISPIKDPYMNGFLHSTFLRKPCYNCQFAKTPRESDITLADFWGIGDDIPFNHPTKQGVSLVLINSMKGQKLFELCKKNAFFEKRTLEEAKKGNLMLTQRQYENPHRKHFFVEYQTTSFEKLIPKYLSRRPSIKYFLAKEIIRVIGGKNLRKIKRLLGRT